MALFLRGPYYDWPMGLSDRVIYDRLWDRALHFPPMNQGFYYSDCSSQDGKRQNYGNEGYSNDGIEDIVQPPIFFVPLVPHNEGEVIADVRFGPDDFYIAYKIENDLFITNREDLHLDYIEGKNSKPDEPVINEATTGTVVNETSTSKGVGTSGSAHITTTPSSPSHNAEGKLILGQPAAAPEPKPRKRTLPLKWNREPHFEILAYFWSPLPNRSDMNLPEMEEEWVRYTPSTRVESPDQSPTHSNDSSGTSNYIADGGGSRPTYIPAHLNRNPYRIFQKMHGFEASKKEQNQGAVQGSGQVQYKSSSENVKMPVPAELVVISTCGIEIFRWQSRTGMLRSSRSFQMLARRVWVEPKVGLVVCCIGARTLQPFDLRPKKSPQKLPKFDLYIGKSKAIDHFDVSIVTLFNETYCVHLDTIHGKVSLRNISDAVKSTPEHDIVFSVMPFAGQSGGNEPNFPFSFFKNAKRDRFNVFGKLHSRTGNEDLINENLVNTKSILDRRSSADSNNTTLTHVGGDNNTVLERISSSLSQNPRGPLRLSILKNLLLVHRVDRAYTWVFDIRYPSSQALAYFRSPLRVIPLRALPGENQLVTGVKSKNDDDKAECDDKGECDDGVHGKVDRKDSLLEDSIEDINKTFDYIASSPVVLDRQSGCVYSIGLDVDALISSFEEHFESIREYHHFNVEQTLFAEKLFNTKMEKVYTTSYDLFLQSTSRQDKENIGLLSQSQKTDKQKGELSFYLLQVLLRRPKCRDRVLYLLQQGLINRLSLVSWTHQFAVLNLAYRDVIDSVNADSMFMAEEGTRESQSNNGRESNVGSKNGGAKDVGRESQSNNAKTYNGHSTISSQNLIQRLGPRTIVTEKDMVLAVFIPMFEALYAEGAQFVVEDHNIIQNVGVPATKSKTEKPVAKDTVKTDAFTASHTESRTSVSSATSSISGPKYIPLRQIYEFGKTDSIGSTVPFLQWKKRFVGKHRGINLNRDGTISRGGGNIVGHGGQGGVDTVDTDLGIDFLSGLTVDPSTGEGPVGSSDFVPYLLQVVLTYYNSLLNQQILPHKILQCFLFDLCVYFEQFQLLQQLLHYNVVVDAPDICKRLVSLLLVADTGSDTSFRLFLQVKGFQVRGNDEKAIQAARAANFQLRQHIKPYLRLVAQNRIWISQCALDMALRFRDFHTVADILCLSGQFLDAIFLLRQTGTTDYPVVHVLRKLTRKIFVLEKKRFRKMHREQNSGAAEGERNHLEKEAENMGRQGLNGSDSESESDEYLLAQMAKPPTLTKEVVEGDDGLLVNQVSTHSSNMQEKAALEIKHWKEKQRKKICRNEKFMLQNCVREIHTWLKEAWDNYEEGPNLWGCESFGLKPLRESDLYDKDAEGNPILGKRASALSSLENFSAGVNSRIMSYDAAMKMEN